MSNAECVKRYQQKQKKRLEDAEAEVVRLRGLLAAEGAVLVPVHQLEFWRNDLSMHGVGGIETAQQLDEILEKS